MTIGTGWDERQLMEEHEVSDIRTAWEHDYSRLVHSAAFRRLQSKTQVLGLGESDFYRTRLTHTMEVAQIAHGILRVLGYKNEQKPLFHGDILPDFHLMNAICLAHDIGHPPFGHGGERALNFCMCDNGGFEGNGHTIRILSKLEKYTENHGINPTRRLLLGVLKYPVQYSKLVNKKFYKKGLKNNYETKWLFKTSFLKPPKCYLDCENDVINWTLLPLETEANDKKNFISFENSSEDEHGKTNYKSLDASILELADDISYATHDLEDAISLQIINRENWMQYFETHKCGVEAFISCNMDHEIVGKKLFCGLSHIRKKQFGSFIGGMIQSSTIYKTDNNFKNSLLIYNSKISDEWEQVRRHLFEIVKHYVINLQNVKLLEFKGQKIIVELFDVITSDPEKFLPDRDRYRYKNAEDGMRVICDYIAGMTDDYATKLYEKIFMTRKGSIFDRL